MIAERWQQLAGRERALVVIAGVVAAIALSYVVIWEPLADARQALRDDVARQAALLDWLERIEPEVMALRQQRPATPSPRAGSPLARIDRSAREAGLAGALVRIEPQGSEFRVVLEQAVFDDVAGWLGDLAGAGFQITGLRADRRAPGRVDASVMLRPPGALAP
ncbi:MAG: type II secretion system protein M [Wenzhouxiangellaceae bacterium]|nr:type II secretion system protein M [Wenzhouxiangellaceae bacterium]